MNMTHLFEMNWGDATVEGYDQKANKAICVFNINIQNRVCAENALQFAFGRLLSCHYNLPDGAGMKFVFDIRGQNVPYFVLDYMLMEMKSLAKKHLLLSNLEIEFYQ